MNETEVRRWFEEYLGAFAACGRGESEVESILHYYGVPLLFSTDNGFVSLTTEEQVAAAVRQQIEQMRSASYVRTEVLSSEVTVLNAASALYRWTVSRRGRDGGEIGRQTFTDLLAGGTSGRRISVIAVHSPPPA